MKDYVVTDSENDLKKAQEDVTYWTRRVQELNNELADAISRLQNAEGRFERATMTLAAAIRTLPLSDSAKP